MASRRSHSHADGPNRRGCREFRGLVSRRHAVQAGTFGALGLSLGDMLRLEARGEASTEASQTTKGGSSIAMVGGLSCELTVLAAGQEIRQRTGKGTLRIDPRR